jgi:CubicO group peptidase (beta-lactamase class C family)
MSIEDSIVSRNLCIAVTALLVSTAAFSQPPADSPVASDADIRKILIDRVGAENQGIALVVGVIEPKGRRVVSYGSLAKDDKRPVNGDTIFEIGSVTKVFTSLVLMDMAQKGELAITDPVSKYLPKTVKVPERNSNWITLRDLATQTSGLPPIPDNFHPKDELNPYADYTVDKLYAFLSGYQLTRDIGSRFEYSNLGFGLLGHALSLRAGMDFDAMVKARILGPLDMKSTGIALTPEMKARLALGHGPSMTPVPTWDLGVLAGAGGLRSSANDMLTFLAANLGYVKTPLAAAMESEISVRRPTGMTGMEIAYGWFIQTKNGKSIVWHDGGTGGYRSYVGFDPKSRVGVVVLSNLSNAEGPGDIGRHLLDATYPLLKVGPPTEHREITVDTKTFDKLIGSYQLAPGAVMTISREGDALYGQLSGQGKVQLFPEGERKFFVKVVDAQVSFDADAQGNITQMVLHQGGQNQAFQRLDAAAAKRAAELDAAVEKRMKDQTQAPGSEAALRRILGEFRAGQPNYGQMTPAFGAMIQQQVTQLNAALVPLGAIQSVTFQSVGPGGADVYIVKFAQGAWECRILLDPDGEVAGLGFRPL